VREYCPGDDVRDIDWNVTARFGHPFVKIYREERELTIMLLVDVSSSCFFGTQHQYKQELAAEIASVLAFAATKNNDKVGLIIFSDRIERYIPPKKGKNHVWRVIREVLDHSALSIRTDIPEALNYLNKITRRKTSAFLISDFISPDYEKALRITAKKHDLIAVNITDPREMELPNSGMVQVRDAETGANMLIDTSSAAVRNGYRQLAEKNRQERQALFRSSGIDCIEVFTDRPFIDPIMKFFRMREKRQ
jgi:uncharacterized protein (DUF58 family)